MITLIITDKWTVVQIVWYDYDDTSNRLNKIAMSNIEIVFNAMYNWVVITNIIQTVIWIYISNVEMCS